MKLTRTLNVYMRQNEDKEEGYELVVIPDDMRWYAYSDDVQIGEQEVSFDVDLPSPKELITMAVDTFEIKIKDLKQECYNEVTKIEMKINNLLTIEHKETV